MKECAGKSDEEILKYLKNKCGIFKWQDYLTQMTTMVMTLCRQIEKDQQAFRDCINKAIDKKVAAMAGKKNLRPEEIVQALKNAEKEVQKDIEELEKQVSDVTGY